MTIFECHQLTKKYGKQVALQDVSLQLVKGQVVGLFGPNGSGKSTFLKMIAGITPPTSGQLTINGLKPGKDTKKIVSYLSDKPSLPHYYSVKTAIKLYDDFFDDFDTSRAEALLAGFEIPLNKNIRHLSKGMYEKLFIALAMSRHADVYLFDEPLGGVDPGARKEIMTEMVRQYNPEALTIITTHMITEMELIFDYAIYFKESRMITHGDTESLRTQYGKSLNDIFLEVTR